RQRFASCCFAIASSGEALPIRAPLPALRTAPYPTTAHRPVKDTAHDHYDSHADGTTNADEFSSLADAGPRSASCRNRCALPRRTVRIRMGEFVLLGGGAGRQRVLESVLL